MKKFSDTKKLVSFLQLNGFNRIGVDGVNLSGKSTLAKTLAEFMNIQHINLDDFLDKNQGVFLESLRYDEISKRVFGAKDYIIEGVCLLEAIKRINTSIDCLIYIKKLENGGWMDEDDCLLDESLEQVIEDRKYLVYLTNPSDDMPNSLGLAEEIMRYHKKYKPQAVADVVYLRETTNKITHND